MKICAINLGFYGSTGKIMREIKRTAETDGINVTLIYPKLTMNFPKEETDIEISGSLNRKFNHFLEKVTGFQNCFSVLKTLQLFSQLKKEQPDLIHLHNLHSVNLNYGLLFRFIKKHNIPVVWTLHDCWPFTGHCPHFVLAHCDKWKTGCQHCPQYRDYPATFVDRSRQMWKLKRKWFTGVPNMTIVTPSQWLADLVRQSYFKDYPVRVINNGIDLNIFKPTPSDFRKRYHLEEKYIVLGVAFPWSVRKGFDVFLELEKKLDRERYKIVLVGTSEEDDQNLPSTILSIHRTNNQQELAEIYSAADVFVNPTREEVLGLVNLEALACGIPVVTFETGGCPECVSEKCGIVVGCDDTESMRTAVIEVCEENMFSIFDCQKQAQKFNTVSKMTEYVKLYEMIRQNNETL